MVEDGPEVLHILLCNIYCLICKELKYGILLFDLTLKPLLFEDI